jgi:hypothetical protein
MNTRQWIAAALVVGTSAFALAGCSTEARAERKGKEFGDQVCHVKSAGNTNNAQRHLRRAQDKLDDLNRFVGRDVRQDLRDVDRNLDQLARDVSAGRNVREQDVNAISRSVESAVSTTSGTSKAAYQGMLEGLNNCN